MFDSSAADVAEVSYGGTRYYRIVTTQCVPDSDVSVAMTSMVTVDNGWYYQYSFGSETGSAQFSDFEALLESATYPDSDSQAALSNPVSLIVTVLILLGGGTIVFLMTIKGKNNREGEIE